MFDLEACFTPCHHWTEFAPSIAYSTPMVRSKGAKKQVYRQRTHSHANTLYFYIIVCCYLSKYLNWIWLCDTKNRHKVKCERESKIVCFKWENEGVCMSTNWKRYLDCGVHGNIRIRHKWSIFINQSTIKLQPKALLNSEFTAFMLYSVCSICRSFWFGFFLFVLFYWLNFDSMCSCVVICRNENWSVTTIVLHFGEIFFRNFIRSNCVESETSQRGLIVFCTVVAMVSVNSFTEIEDIVQQNQQSLWKISFFS